MEQFIGLCLTKDQDKRPKASELATLDLFTNDEKPLLVVFEAVEHELFYSELLRSMAEEICEFGSSTHRSTEFIQIYLLKRAYSIVNLLSYSLLSHQNYLNVPPDMFDLLCAPTHAQHLAELCEKLGKESILVTALFKDKYCSFEAYLSKFQTEEAELAKRVVAADQLYADIDAGVFKAELGKWAQAL